MERSLLAGFLVSLYFFVLFPFCESQKKPKDYQNCKLNASSPFANVVQIYDSWIKKEKDLLPVRATPAQSHFKCGSLITPVAVLSTAWSFVAAILKDDWDKSGKYGRYTVIGQNIWDTVPDGVFHPCYQKRTVRDIPLHPRASEWGSRLHYDFSVVIMSKQFDVDGPSYPKTVFPQTPLELLLSIRYVNVQGKGVKCTLPVPNWESFFKQGQWTLDKIVEASSVPFRTKCLKNKMCEQADEVLNKWSVWSDAQKAGYIQKCKQKFNNVINGTMLCMDPLDRTSVFMDDPPVPTSYAGVPLVCNESTLGVISQVKKGNTQQGKKREDFFLVVTLLRIHSWLKEKINQQQVLTTISEADKNTYSYEKYQKPTRVPTPDWGHGDFLRPCKNVQLPVDVNERRPLSLAPAAMYDSSCFWKILTVCHAFHLIYRIHFHQTQAS